MNCGGLRDLTRPLYRVVSGERVPAKAVKRKATIAPLRDKQTPEI